MKKQRQHFLLGVVCLLVACTSAGQPVAEAPTARPVLATSTATPFQPTYLYVPMPSPSPTTLPRLWLDERLPTALAARAEQLDAVLVASAQEAEVQWTVLPTGETGSLWIYALIAPFSTLRDDITADQLRHWWADGELSTLFVPPEALGFTQVWGAPSAAVQVLPQTDDVLAAVRQGRGWGLVPFARLQPDVKVIRVDGLSPLDKAFIARDWPLQLVFGFQPARPEWQAQMPTTNRQAERLTTLAMTGVTALVRATAGRMETEGVLYPGRDVRDWLRAADITHISNEIPFYEQCPPPSPYQTSLIFCSDPRYVALLEDIGTDIVELTGNHFQDYGSKATLQTLALYDALGWPYFGGGSNVAEARRPVLLEHNGNRLAFIGCNAPGPDYAWATESRPGAAPCDDMAWLQETIRALKDEGYLVVVTFQHYETYALYPPPNLVRDFSAAASAGAVIVSGSQAHYPHAMAWQEGAFVHYGLGNLFFDQMDVPVASTRRAFIDRYTFYDGRLIGVELLTTMLEDYARPRPMTKDERQALLRDVFAASGWTVYP